MAGGLGREKKNGTATADLLSIIASRFYSPLVQLFQVLSLQRRKLYLKVNKMLGCLFQKSGGQGMLEPPPMI